MAKAAKTLGLTLIWLVLFDIAVAVVLSFEIGPLAPLDRYFHLGRSVPGKLEIWQTETVKSADNLLEIGWIETMVAQSGQDFEQETAAGPVVRSYGMSFVNNILAAAQSQDPDLVLDNHAGPMVPPNWTYGAFLDDRANRREGDIVVLGILSGSVPGMAALSNRTWGFEQPAPVTYPIFRPDGDTGLIRLDPLVQSAEDERALITDPAATAAWGAQLRAEDRLYTRQAFAWPYLDISPFARLVRRAVAWNAIDGARASVIEDQEWAETLRRMVVSFGRIAREDGQIPVVMLVQTQAPDPVDLLAVLEPVLTAQAIPTFATADHASPKNPANFVADGHYTHIVDARFGAAFLNTPAVSAARSTR